jgi:hypothetical protein
MICTGRNLDHGTIRRPKFGPGTEEVGKPESLLARKPVIHREGWKTRRRHTKYHRYENSRHERVIHKPQGRKPRMLSECALSAGQYQDCLVCDGPRRES